VRLPHDLAGCVSPSHILDLIAIGGAKNFRNWH
jgi:hypothetical protein